MSPDGGLRHAGGSRGCAMLGILVVGWVLSQAPVGPPGAIVRTDDPAVAERAAQLAISLETRHAAFMKAALPIGGGKTRERAFTSLKAQLEATSRRWRQIALLGSPQWALTALVREGELRWHFAAAIKAGGAPPEVKRLGNEAVDAYLELLEQQAAELRREARESWAAAALHSKEWNVPSPALEAVRPYRLP